MGLLLCLFLLFPALCYAFSTDGGGHLTFTGDAIALETQKRMGDERFADWSREVLDGGSIAVTGNFLTGAYDEDSTTINKAAMQELPIPGSTWPRGPNGWGDFFEHFFNPRTGAGLWSNRTAIDRAEGYERKIKDVICEMSSQYFQLNETSRKKVNDYFGRLMHLLQDMGMSYHTKIEVHPFKSTKPLENYVENKWDTIKISDLFREEYSNTNYSKGNCVDPIVPMFRLAQWSNGMPANVEYWECISLPSEYCELKTKMVADNATRMAARATKFTEGYIDQIWKAINSDCICNGPPNEGVGRGQPDDTFSVNGSFLGKTQFELSAVERLDFFLPIALKKGDVSPFYTKQLIEIYGEAQSLPLNAPQETKNEIHSRFQSVLAELNNIPVMDQNEWADIALLKHGFYDEALALINATQQPVRLIDTEVDPSSLRSYPILVIPSGGLIGLEKSAILKAILDEYVKNGGTLIVFSQPYGYHYSILPVPTELDGTTLPVNGYGWEEDQNCFANAVYLDTWHQMFAGQSRITPSTNVDGYFTIFPSTSTTLLRRTVNGQPAMLSYEHGQGRVIITSMYSDFAFGQSQASPEERSLVRDVIAWAKKPIQLPEINRGESLSLVVEVANQTDRDAASAKLLILNPDRSVIISEQVISANIPPHGSSQLAIQFETAPNAQRGVYHVDFVLLDNQGAILQPQTESDSGRFAVLERPGNPYRSPDFYFSITSNVELVTVGGDIVFTVHSWNNGQQQKTITARYVFPHMYIETRDPSYGLFIGSVEPGTDSGWLTKTFTIGPSGKISFDHIMRNARHDDFIFVNFYDENNKLIGRAMRGYFLFLPTARATVSSNRNIYVPGDTILANAEFINLNLANFPATARISLVDVRGVVIIEEERAIVMPSYGTSLMETHLVVPENLTRGKCVVIASLSAGGEQIASARVPVDVEPRTSNVSVVPALPRPLRAGLNNVSFTLTNFWSLPVTSGVLEIDLQDSNGFSIMQNSYPLTISPGEIKVIDMPIIFSNLVFGSYYLFYTYSDETKTGRPARMIISNESMIGFATDKPIHKAGETLTATTVLVNNGKFALSNVEVVVTIPGLGLNQTQVVTVRAGERIVLPSSFLLPSDTPPGHYEINCSAILPSGSRVSQTSWFDIPLSSLVITFPGSRSVTSGSTIQLFIENVGGADTNYTGRVFIHDTDGVVFSEINLSDSLRVGECKTLANLLVPPQTVKGRHTLTADLHDLVSGSNSSLNVTLDIMGATASLQSRSSKDVYFLPESIAAISDIVNNGVLPVDNGNLEVAVKTFAGQPGFAHFLPKTGWLGVEPLFITISPDGSIYISEACRILHLDASWNLIEEWGGSCGTGNGQFNGATCLAVGTDGSVYVVDSGNHRVQRFTSYGAFLQVWGGLGYDDGQFRWPSDLAIGPDGTIYVSDTRNNRIQKFSADGVFIRKWGFYGTGNGNFSEPAGLSLGLDGSVYVADSGNHRIQRFTPDGAYVAKWGSEGEGDGQFFRPQALAVASDGNVYVGNNERIQRFTADGVFISSGGSMGMEAGQFLEVISLAAGSDGSIYAVDSYNNDVQRFDSNLGFISHWGNHGSQNGWFYHPSHLAISPDGFLYVSDTYNNRIQKFTYSGDFIESWGSEGSGNGEFNYPAGVAASPEGSLFVADSYNHRIQKFDNEGRFVMTWGGEGTDDGKFSYPNGLAVNSKGEVYVADRVNNRIQKFDAHGTFIAKWSAGMPEGITIGPDGSVYTFDYVYHPGWSKHVQRFDENGTLLNEWEWWSTANSGAIAVDSQGYVYLADGTYIHRFDSSGNYLEQLEAPGACWDLVFAGNGTMFCADTDSSRILKYQPSGGKTVFERNIPLALNPHESRVENTQIGTLDEPGKYFLNATLTNSLGQKLAHSEYPFYVAHEDMVLKLSPDKTFYRPDEVVTIQGEIQNLTVFALQGLSFALTQQTSAGVQSLSSTILDVPPGGSYPFTVTTQAGSEGIYRLIGAIAREDTRVFEATDRYEVVLPSLTVNLKAPDVAGSDSFTISLEIKNDGKTDTTFTLTSPFDSQVVTVPRGTTFVQSYPNQQIRADTVYTFVISGDVSRTISRVVSYGLASMLAIHSSEMYQEGPAAIPISISNVGSQDAAFQVSISLEPSGLISQKTYFVPQGGVASDTLLFDLSEGDYTLTLSSQTPPASTGASFSVRKEDAITLAPIVIRGPSGGLITASGEITNHGYRAIEGLIELSVLSSAGSIALQSAQAVSLPANASPIPFPINLNFSSAMLQPGSYTVKIAFLNEGLQELVSQTIPLVLTGASIRLSQVPTSLSVTAGEEAVFAFGISNSGGKEAFAELTFKSHDFINLTRRQLMSPGEEKTVQFSFPVPADLEEKDYYGEYELKGEGGTIGKGQVKYHVSGIHISVAASLDKDSYREGETARLAMTVNQQGGGGSRNFFARVNYGDHEGSQVFSLSGSQNLSFDIPLTTISGEKLFYGVYDEGGRSIHLNSLYIYKTGDAITITTNKQVYRPEETVVMTITGTRAGEMTIYGPGGNGETFSFGGLATRSFVLPRAVRAGTYYIEASLAAADGQTIKTSKPIDIAGIAVKVKEAVLDKGKYMPGDFLRLTMRIESNTDIPAATLKVWSTDPGKISTLIGERPLSLTRGEVAILSSDFPTAITSSGIHKVVYGIYSQQLLLSSGSVSFDAGDGVVLGMATDRNNYPVGSEAVTVRLNLYGTSEATLVLNLNGAPVRSEPVSLNGFTPMTIQLPAPGPGAHVVEAILTAGGLSSRKETKFLYGSNLPDFTADMWGSGTSIGKDGTLKLLATAGNHGKTSAAPTSMTLYDGTTLLAAFSVGEIAAGASKTYEYLWNVMGKAGEHNLSATIDPSNSITEFTKENNQVTRRIVIPDIALISETDRDSYRIGEQVAINATTINLTSGTNYPNLTCTTIVRDLAGAEVHRQSNNLGLAPSRSALTTATWSTAGIITDGKYTIRQEVWSGTTLLAEKTKNLTITAGTGFALAVSPASLRVKQGETAVFTVSINSSPGWNGTVTLSAESLPSGATVNLAPSTVIGSGTSVLSITTNRTTPTGTYPITIIAQGNDGGATTVQSLPIALDVSGFSLQATPASVSVTQLETADSVVNVQSLNGYEGNITLSDATGSLGGLIITIANPNLAVPGEAVVRVQASKNVLPGTYTIKLSGSDGIISKDVNLEVVVWENTDIITGFVLTPGPGFDNRAMVTLMSRNFVEKVEFTAFNTRFGANAVMGDIDGDGDDEIIVAPGPDPLADGRIRVFRKNATLVFEQPVLTTKFGATLAAGDIDGDWREEVVVGAGLGLRNAARVKVLSFDGQRFANTGIDFVAFPESYKLGVKIALGDVDGDGVLEIVAGAGPSPLSPARIKVFKIDTTGGMGRWRVASTLSDFVANFGDWYPYLFGVNVAAGDVDGDGEDEIIAGAGPNPLQKAVVAVYKGNGTFTGVRFEAYPANDYRFGVNVAARDLDGDGVAEIITGLGPSPLHESWVRVFKGDGSLLSDGFLAFPESMKSGVKVSTGNVGE